ncbi:unnamed protein product [Auanema sp. JU1783]|nr:unnamed protein product [Auanema sp. JU1783]
MSKLLSSVLFKKSEKQEKSQKLFEVLSYPDSKNLPKTEEQFNLDGRITIRTTLTPPLVDHVRCPFNSIEQSKSKTNNRHHINIMKPALQSQNEERNEKTITSTSKTAVKRQFEYEFYWMTKEEMEIEKRKNETI